MECFREYIAQCLSITHICHLEESGNQIVCVLMRRHICRLNVSQDASVNFCKDSVCRELLRQLVYCFRVQSQKIAGSVVNIAQRGDDGGGPVRGAHITNQCGCQRLVDDMDCTPLSTPTWKRFVSHASRHVFKYPMIEIKSSGNRSPPSSRTKPSWLFQQARKKRSRSPSLIWVASLSER